jgi:hypothetical protein
VEARVGRQSGRRARPALKLSDSAATNLPNSLPPGFRAPRASITKPEKSKMDRSLDIFVVLLPIRSRTRRVPPNGWETALVLRGPRRQSCA